MARKPSVEVYAPQELIAQINSYQQENDLDSFSAAARELWRMGLEHQAVEA